MYGSSEDVKAMAIERASSFFGKKVSESDVIDMEADIRADSREMVFRMKVKFESEGWSKLTDVDEELAEALGKSRDDVLDAMRQSVTFPKTEESSRYSKKKEESSQTKGWGAF